MRTPTGSVHAYLPRRRGEGSLGEVASLLTKSRYTLLDHSDDLDQILRDELH